MNKNRRNRVLFPDRENGIYLYEYPVINGIKQYVQIRGKSKRNPLLLFVHGGPGGSLAGICEAVQDGWEDKFTVVNWDQRNSCKTFFANKNNAEAIAGTGTLDDYVQDIDDVVSYLHTVYEFDRLILMGFSWGSIIACEYAKKHPEKLLCYIGVGQYTEFYESFSATCESIEKMASEMRNKADLKKIEYFKSTIPTQPKISDEFMKSYGIYNMLGMKYISKHARPFPLKALMKSPFLNFREKMSLMKQDYKMFARTYITMMEYNFKENMRFEIPLLFVFGNEDYICRADLFKEIYSEISAPEKKLTIIENAGHSCFYDRPEDFLKTVCDFVSIQ